MKLQTVIETENGDVQFSGELTNEQVKFLLEVGLNIVMANGAVPFMTQNEYEDVVAHPGTDTQQ